MVFGELACAMRCLNQAPRAANTSKTHSRALNWWNCNWCGLQADAINDSNMKALR